MIDLHEADAALHQPAGQQTLFAENLRYRLVHPIELLRRPALLDRPGVPTRVFLAVGGVAVDLGDADATAWLSRHGGRYGLCQIYRNEPWHYELRPRAVQRGCPRMYADPTQDPRMRR